MDDRWPPEESHFPWYPAPPPPVEPAGEQPPGADASPRRRRRAVAAVVAGLLLLLSGVGIGWGFTQLGTNGSPTAASGGVNGSNVGSVAGKVSPAVVDVKTYMSVGSYPFSQGRSTPLGAGTGMILTSTGEVLTNNHVIEGATRIEVTSPTTSKTWTATVLGADPTKDVALLQLQGASSLPTVTLADTSALKVGTSVVAIGNALGQGGSPTVTKGAITAIGRSIDVGDGRGGSEHLDNLIQTDASISPGDSGGPLVDSSGRVLGIITASAQDGLPVGGSSSSVGFAIPANDAFDIVRQVRTGHGSSTLIVGPAGFLGVQVRDVDAATAQALGLSSDAGAYVVQAVPGTPAAGAGIGAGSVITAIDGQTISSADALGPALHVHKPGEEARVTWADRNGSHTAMVKLVEGPAV